MLFAKQLLSTMPHARVTRIDASAALAMPGVKAMVTADDLPKPAGGTTDLGQKIAVDPHNERALAKIVIEYQPLPFVVDPLDSLRPGGPNARTDGNVWVPKPGDKNTGPFAPLTVGELKWTEADFAEAAEGRLPMGKPGTEWKYGDIDAGFKSAALVLDETFVTPNVSHQTLETRTAMAYWQNGKVYVHCSTQSTVQTVAAV